MTLSRRTGQESRRRPGRGQTDAATYLCHAKRHRGREALIRAAIETGDISKLHDIQAVIESTGALQYTAARAKEAADLAISALSDVPDSDYKEAMIAIADFAVKDDPSLSHQIGV